MNKDVTKGNLYALDSIAIHCKNCYCMYTEGKSLANYFCDSHFRRNLTFNLIISKI